MKTLFTIVVALLISFTASSQDVKTQKEMAKERKEMAKLSKKELNSRATKDARKEARKLKKDDWTVAPGALPIVKQLDRSYLMQYEYDQNAYPKFIMAEAMAIGENYDGAKIQALELAKLNLAGQIQTEIKALIENTVSNQQLSADEAATVTKSIAVSKNIISQSLGRILPVIEIHRVINNGNREVLVRLAYNFATAKEVVKDAARKDIEKQGEDLHMDLEKLLNW